MKYALSIIKKWIICEIVNKNIYFLGLTLFSAQPFTSSCISKDALDTAAVVQ